MNVLNIASYKFVAIPDREKLKLIFQARCDELQLKGTVLLAEEGINLNLAGSEGAITKFLEFLRSEEVFANRFADMEMKTSYSANQPFRKMVVRLPKEIITMKRPTIAPAGGRAASVDPLKLKKWIEQGHDDDDREIVLLDTRNTYEVELGKFEGALDFNIENFSEFPERILAAINAPGSELSEKTIVTYCTGGIRCEKAALFMNEIDLSRVFQLEGGILNYFAAVGGSHWNGECFVFDERYALDPNLQPTKRNRAQDEGRS